MAPNLLPPLSAVRYILPLTLGLLGPLTLGLLGPRFLSGAISFPELLLPLTVSNLLSLSGKVRCLLPLILASLGRGAARFKTGLILLLLLMAPNLLLCLNFRYLHLAILGSLGRYVYRPATGCLHQLFIETNSQSMISFNKFMLLTPTSLKFFNR